MLPGARSFDSWYRFRTPHHGHGRAGVDRAVLVPMANESWKGSLEFCDRSPGKFVVMAVLPLGDRRTTMSELEQLADTRGVAGVRISTYAEPELHCSPRAIELVISEDPSPRHSSRHEHHGAPGMLAELAGRYPEIMFMLDHLGLDPLKVYADFDITIHETGPTREPREHRGQGNVHAERGRGGLPFLSLHDPLQRVIEAFGPSRVFWGSDLTRLTCSYLECKQLFTKELAFLSRTDIGWIMGDGLSIG